MMKALIVEDERMAQAQLARLLKTHFPDIEVVQCTASVAETVTYLAADPPIDVVFMDVELADGECFEIFRKVPVKARVIMTTAYDSYALKAFEAGSVDYLLKPIGEDALKRAVDRCRERTGAGNGLDVEKLLAAISAPQKQYKERFIVYVGEQIIPVRTDAIASFFSEEKSNYLLTDVVKTAVDKLNKDGKKTGLITVHLYRPFSVKYLMAACPKSVKRICVLDRTKEPGANGDPLYLDVVEAFKDSKIKPLIIGGRYGLSSKDTTPSHILSVFKNLEAKSPKNQFTIGIVDDVTGRSLPLLPEVSMLPAGTFEAKFYGLGADGTVGANKNSIKIIGENTDKYCQAYFDYDSKKSGGYTCSHLRFGDLPIAAPYLVNTPDFVAVHVPSYLEKYDCLRGLKKTKAEA